MSECPSLSWRFSTDDVEINVVETRRYQTVRPGVRNPVPAQITINVAAGDFGGVEHLDIEAAERVHVALGRAIALAQGRTVG